MKSIFTVTFGIGCCCTALAANQPNVVLMMTDDQGYGDIAAHGNPAIQTPNMDRLHAQSIRLTDFHVDPTCAPTRSALMTGKYSHHVRVWHTIRGGNHLRATETTMADVFKHNGYRTGMFGKWHLGSNYPFRPIDRGFDEWLGLGDGGPGTTDDYFWNDRVNDTYWHNGEREAQPRVGYNPDVFCDAAIDFIKQKDSEKPFFIYLPTYVPHSPRTLPDPTLVDKCIANGAPKEVAPFFAMIQRADYNLGRLRQALADEGLEQDTIFIFMTDNGSAAGWRFFNAGMSGGKCTTVDGGHRVPCFIHWPNGSLGQPRDITTLAAHIDLLPTLADLCSLHLAKPVDFDGSSLVPLMKGNVKSWPARTLCVEKQREEETVKGAESAVLTQRWRLIDQTKLYEIAKDPKQLMDVAAQHPEVVQQLNADFNDYWTTVTPDDRSYPVAIAGTPYDPEIFLSTSDLRNCIAYTHDQVSRGVKAEGVWHLEAAVAGTYEFEVRRWPKEVAAPITGVPVSAKTVDSWSGNRPVKGSHYGDKYKALPIDSASLNVGDFSEKRKVSSTAESVIFLVKLPAGQTTVDPVFYDQNGTELTKAYYVYVRKK